MRHVVHVIPGGWKSPVLGQNSLFSVPDNSWNYDPYRGWLARHTEKLKTETLKAAI